MINLLLAMHNHQPVGNFDHVFEQGFAQCYWPVLNTFAEFPSIRFSMHHSGPLLDWARQKEPAYLEKMVKMIESGQLEVLGGGYYEPILAIIPPRDAAGQIEMMNDFWQKTANVTPKGIWLTERIWEPSLASTLAENGVKYTILDDEHFRAAGMTDEFILNYYLTERHGQKLGIFASDSTLRYKIPFKTPEDVIAHLNYLAKTYPGACVTYGDDGEKFGMWPGTFEWVIQKGWLKKFLTLLTQNTATIRTCTMSDYFEANRPAGNVYLPTCSYHEMGEWAMPAHAIHRLDGVKQFLESHSRWNDAKPFVRGGYWDNFLTKYPESNYMHKRMIQVSERIAAETSSNKNLHEARAALYRSQCNCPYWHGMFGGLYLNYLRHAIYSNIINAENLLDAASPSAKAACEAIDIDCDGVDEIRLANSEIISVIKTSRGGCMMEFSNRRAQLNLTDVLARREEAYHKKGAETNSQPAEKSGIPSIHDLHKDLGNTNPITYDPCSRHSFCDHIWPVDASHHTLDAGKGSELTHLCKTPYSIVQKTDSVVKISAAHNNGPRITKTFELEEKELRVHYFIEWPEPLKEDVRFGTELNLSLLAGHDEGRYIELPDGEKALMDSSGANDSLNEIKLVDKYFDFKLAISSDRKMDVWRYPVYTFSQSEKGFDLLYQGSCIIWSTIAAKGLKTLEFTLTLKFE